MSHQTQRSLISKYWAAPVSSSVTMMRDDRRGDQLGVRVLERGAGRLAVILEHQDVLEARILLEIHHPLAVRASITSATASAGIEASVAP